MLPRKESFGEHGHQVCAARDGIVPLENMLPETALMKLSWVLGHSRDRQEVMRMMREPVSHEMTEREPHNGYLILQGGLPETDEFISSHWK